MENAELISEKLENYLKKIVEKAYSIKLEEVHVEHPEMLSHGDFATNICLVLAPRVEQSPMEIAKKLHYEIEQNPLMVSISGQDTPLFENVETASPGFINFVISRDWLKNVPKMITLREEEYGSAENLKNKKVIIEYTDPNPFKIFHAGHLMTNTIGESLSRILEFCGAKIKRANYQGDVGIHVANSIWGLIKKMSKDNLTLVDLQKMTLKKRIEYLGSAYSLGAAAYENNEQAKEEIQSLNNYIYAIAQQLLVENEDWEAVVGYDSLTKDTAPPFDLDKVASLYKAGRRWSLDYFETIYEVLGTEFDLYYFESKAGEVGLKIVLDHLQDEVFKRDQGAIIFEGEKHGLHTRVFVNSKGLPVYEAKDLGLATLKKEDYKYDLSYIVTGNEVNDYFKVVLKAMEHTNSELAEKTTHIGHGMLDFKDKKMSSRTGDVVSATKLIDDIRRKVTQKMSENDIVNKGEKEHKKQKEEEKITERVAISSIKYSILKNGIGKDVLYDQEEATKIIGNTGPYLLYTYARTNSVLEKAKNKIKNYEIKNMDLSEYELDILRHIYKFPETVREACEKLAPNLIAGFVFELAQKYNTFYANDPIIKASSREKRNFRLQLTKATGQIISKSMDLLGIKVVDRM